MCFVRGIGKWQYREKLIGMGTVFCGMICFGVHIEGKILNVSVGGEYRGELMLKFTVFCAILL
jgi:hypothetical protein